MFVLEKVSPDLRDREANERRKSHQLMWHNTTCPLVYETIVDISSYVNIKSP